MAKQSYRPDIDGLRAIAVLLVILFHTGMAFPGGFIGVDVFFVISGYLIAGIILPQITDDRFKLTDFWARRIRRIAPAQLLMCTTVLFAGAIVFMPADFRSLGEAMQSQMLLASNFFFYDNFGYFDSPAELHPLLHTWSLAVEEQFYLAFPLFLLLCRRMKKRRIVSWMAVFTCASFAMSAGTSVTHPAFAFYLLPTRAWELLTGALVSQVPALSDKYRRKFFWLQDLPMAMIISAAILFRPDMPFPGYAALLPCLAAALLIYLQPGSRSLSGRLLNHKWIVGTGLISYSLYLWHWPAIVFVRYVGGLDLNLGWTLFAVALTVLLAVVSHRFVEQPIRYRTSEISTFQLISMTGLLSVLLLFAGYSIRSLDGIPARISADVLELAARSKLQLKYATVKTTTRDSEDFPDLGLPSSQSGQVDFLVWGDSHAVAVSPLIDELAIRHGLAGKVASRSGIVPLIGPFRARRSSDKVNEVEWNLEILDYVRRRQIKHVIIISRWSLYAEGIVNGKMKSLVIDRDSTSASIEESRNVIERGIASTLNKLRELGVRVWIFRQLPDQLHDPCREYLTMARFGLTSPRRGTTLAKYHTEQDWVNRILSKFAGSEKLTLLSPSEYCFDKEGYSRTGGNGLPYYADACHLSPTGVSVLLEPMLSPVLSEIATTCERSPDRRFRLTSQQSTLPIHREATERVPSIR